MTKKARFISGVIAVTILTITIWFFPIGKDGCFECIPTMTPEVVATRVQRSFVLENIRDIPAGSCITYSESENTFYPTLCETPTTGKER